MSRDRIAAAVSLLCATAGLVTLGFLALVSLPLGLVMLLGVIMAARITRNAVLRRGAARPIRLVTAFALLVLTVIVILRHAALLTGLVGVTLVVVGIVAARNAFRIRADLPWAERPASGGHRERPVGWRHGREASPRR